MINATACFAGKSFASCSLCKFSSKPILKRLYGYVLKAFRMLPLCCALLPAVLILLWSAGFNANFGLRMLLAQHNAKPLVLRNVKMRGIFTYVKPKKNSAEFFLGASGEFLLF